MGSFVCEEILDTFDRRAPRTAIINPALPTTGWYWTLLAFVGLVSVYDAYLTYALRLEILDMEENPVGLMLIRLDPHSLSFFLLAKALGTAFVILLLATAEFAGTRGLRVTRQFFRTYRERSPLSALMMTRLNQVFCRYRQTILTGVASFQMWLLWYLSMSE